MPAGRSCLTRRKQHRALAATHRLVLPTFAVGYFAMVTSSGMFGPVLATLSASLSMSTGAAGQLSALTPLTWALLAPMVGPLSDRFGTLRRTGGLALMGVWQFAGGLGTGRCRSWAVADRDWHWRGQLWPGRLCLRRGCVSPRSTCPGAWRTLDRLLGSCPCRSAGGRAHRELARFPRRLCVGRPALACGGCGHVACLSGGTRWLGDQVAGESRMPLRERPKPHSVPGAHGRVYGSPLVRPTNGAVLLGNTLHQMSAGA